MRERDTVSPLRLVGRRLAGLVVVWFVISIIAFALGKLAPGDPAEMILLRRTGDVPSEVDVARVRAELGLDRPVVVQYATWLGRALRGDLGRTYRGNESVFDALRNRFPATLLLAVSSLVLAILLAVPLGALAAYWPDTWVDHGARVTALAGVSMPSYWLAYVLMLAFGVSLGWLPVSGSGSARHLVLPALTLALGGTASLARLLRANLLDELGADYARTARAKGASPLRVLLRHALRNAANPFVTVSAIRFGRLLGEAVIVETVFGWPGIGRFLVESIYDRDYPAIQGFVLYMALVYTLVNLLADLLYGWLDPRVRVGERGTSGHSGAPASAATA